jgi:hypothetical protein
LPDFRDVDFFSACFMCLHFSVDFSFSVRLLALFIFIFYRNKDIFWFVCRMFSE